MATRSIEKQLIAKGDSKIALRSQGFFKTGTGEYAEGDKFLGLRVPLIRAEVKEHRGKLSLTDIVELLQSEWHEVRLFALLAMVDYYQRGDERNKKSTVTAYIKNRKQINNWDLVDSSAYQIIGAWHHGKSRKPVDKLVTTSHLWSRRIAMMSTFYHIRLNDLDDTYRYALMLINDNEDLMHKVSGWMLREAGKRDSKRLVQFLTEHGHNMPRTMLRYAIEKLPEKTRKRLLKQSA